jgi:hypothetical protein
MADPLSIAAGVVGLLTFAGLTVSKGYQLLHDIQGSKAEVQQVLTSLARLTGILATIEAQQKADPGPAKVSMPPPSSPLISQRSPPIGRERERSVTMVSQVVESCLQETRKLIKDVSDVLEKFQKSRRAVLTIKLKLQEPELKRLTTDIEHNKSLLIMCMGVDSRFVNRT